MKTALEIFNLLKSHPMGEQRKQCPQELGARILFTLLTSARDDLMGCVDALKIQNENQSDYLLDYIHGIIDGGELTLENTEWHSFDSSVRDAVARLIEYRFGSMAKEVA